jgi:phage pi2 protein 07
MKNLKTMDEFINEGFSNIFGGKTNYDLLKIINVQLDEVEKNAKLNLTMYKEFDIFNKSFLAAIDTINSFNVKPDNSYYKDVHQAIDKLYSLVPFKGSNPMAWKKTVEKFNKMTLKYNSHKNLRW